jgi:hypothetical protein
MAQKGNTASERLKGEGGREREESLGVPVDGTADPTGEYPKRYNWYGNSVSAAGRGVKINHLKLGGSGFGVSFDVAYPSPSIHPFNYAMETPSGHSIEIDDTPGNERILLRHHTGGGIEIQPDGVVVIASNGKGVTVTNGDYNLAVNGAGEMIFDGDLNMRVNGNYNLDVNGTYNLTTGNNFNQQVHGTLITETGDTHQTIVRGNKDVKVYGDNNDFVVGEKKIITKKDLRILSNRDIISNAHRHVRMTAEEKITGSSGDGLTLASEKVYITGRKGKIGGDKFHYIGSLFTGPSSDDKDDSKNDQGQKTVFHGNLIGRALEAWTSKYSLNAREAHSAHISNFATVAKVADQAQSAARASFATTALGATTWMPPITLPIPHPDLYPDWEDGYTYEGAQGDIVGGFKPDYKFKWGWEVKETPSMNSNWIFWRTMSGTVRVIEVRLILYLSRHSTLRMKIGSRCGTRFLRSQFVR